MIRKPELVPLRVAVAILGVSGSTVRRMVKEGRLSAAAIPSGQLRFSLAELQRLARTYQPKKLKRAYAPTTKSAPKP